MAELRYKVRDPEGNIYEGTNIAALCREHDLVISSMNKLVHGTQDSHKGWALVPKLDVTSILNKVFR